MTHPFDKLSLENGAGIIFTPCPGTKDTSISDALATLKSQDMTMILTLLPDQELQKLSVMEIADECSKLNIIWRQLPIIDDQGPTADFEQNWQNYKDEIVQLLANGGTIAVHCKGGTGRTGLVIALILTELDYSFEQILEKVQAIRPKALRNEQQLNYFKQYYAKR